MGFLKRLFSGQSDTNQSYPPGAGVQPEQVPEVTAQQLRDGLGAGEPIVLVDVRENWEWHTGHLDDALHIPLGQLPQRVAELDHDADVVVYCHLGNRSLYAAAFLQQEGFQRVASLAGGIEAWEQLRWLDEHQG